MCLDGTVPRNTEFASALSHDVLKDICPSRPFVRTELFRVGSAATEWQPLLVEYAKKWMMYHANEAQTSGLVDQEHFLEELKSNWAYWHSALRSPDVAVALMNYGLPSLIRLHCLQTNRAADGSAEKMLRRLAASGCYLNIGDWYHNCAVALRALTEEHISAQDRGTRRYVLEQIAVEIDWQSLASKAVYSHHTFSMLFRLLERSVSIGAFFLVALAPKDRLSAMCRVAGFRDFHKMLTAILRTDVSVHDIFEDEISGSEVLCWASSKGHCELVQILVAEPGLSVNTRWDKSTPLHWAIQSRQKTVVEFLLKNTDTDVNCYDRSSRTALHMAVEQGDHDTLKMLLSRPEIDVNARDGGGNDATPLQLAVQAGDAIVLGLLLDRREIDVNTWDQSGETPLMSAIASRNKECVRRLFETGRVDVNRKDRWGWTFLHWAVIAGDVSIIETLLSICKLDLRIRDDSGSTPIQLAHANGNKEVYDLLAKADRETTNGTSSQGRVSWSVDDMIRMSTVPM
jgi:ankyrin repeat protein